MDKKSHEKARNRRKNSIQARAVLLSTGPKNYFE